MLRIFLQYLVRKTEMIFNKYLIFLFLIATCSDLLTTYYGTPDLANELNYVVLMWGWDWFGLGIYNVLFFICISTLYWFTFTALNFKYARLPDHNNGFTSFLKFFAFYEFYVEEKEWSNLFNIDIQIYKIIVKMLGFILIAKFIVSRFLAAIQNVLYGSYYRLGMEHWLGKLGYEWSMLNHSISNKIGLSFSHPTLFVKDFIGIFTGVLFFYLFINKEYRNWKVKAVKMNIHK